MRRLLPLITALLLGACAGPPTGPPSPPPPTALAPTLPAIGELLAAPSPGPVRAVGYLFTSPDGAVLVDGLRLSGAGAPAPLATTGIWLGVAPPLPPGTPLTTAGAVSYTIVEADGRLMGPGQYGPAGRYSYSLAEPTLRPRSARDLTIPLLLANDSLYQGQPVRLQGQLLVSPDTALLVESLGPGGVPDPRALQVKLAAIPADPALAALKQTANGQIRYGAVELIGLWRTGRLYPLAILPLE